MAGEDIDGFLDDIEDEFDITIDDADAVDITTCRELSDYIISKLEGINTSDPRCLSQAQFYRLRSILVNDLGIERKEIHPKTPIHLLLGPNIKQQWKKLKKAVNPLQFPSLRCKDYLHVLGILIFACSTILLGEYMSREAAIGLGVTLYFILLVFISSRFADQLSATYTVGSLVSFIEVDDLGEDWKKHPDYILQRIIVIAADNFGIEIDEIHPDAHFINDLGVK